MSLLIIRTLEFMLKFLFKLPLIKLKLLVQTHKDKHIFREKQISYNKAVFQKLFYRPWIIIEIEIIIVV